MLKLWDEIGDDLQQWMLNNKQQRDAAAAAAAPIALPQSYLHQTYKGRDISSYTREDIMNFDAGKYGDSNDFGELEGMSFRQLKAFLRIVGSVADDNLPELKKRLKGIIHGEEGKSSIIVLKWLKTEKAKEELAAVSANAAEELATVSADIDEELNVTRFAEV